MKKLVLGVILLTLSVSLSCVKNSQCPAAKIVNSGAEDPVMAVINDETITESTFDKALSGRDRGSIIKAKSELYEAKMEALEEYVFNKLITAEAKSKNMSTEDFMKKEVDAKVKKPTAQDVDKFYKEVKAQYEKNGKTPPPLNDAVKEQIKQQLTMKGTLERRQALNNELTKKNKVTFGLEQPRIAVTNGTNAVKGSEKAKITIVEFSDFQCPFCKKGADTMKEVMKKYNGKVQYYFRDYPLSFHDRAKQAANASRCAAEQGKFWQFHDTVFAEQSKLSDDDLIAVGKKLNLDMTKYEPCVKEMKNAAKVESDMHDGENAGVTGTPAYFINGIFVSGALPLNKFEAIIDSELKK
jgi:protein-disulfide isomerase